MPDPATPPAGGNPQPGADPNNPGTGDAPQYVSKEDFGKTAAVISGLQKTLKTLTDGLLTPDKLVELGLLEKDETGGSYKPKASGPPKDPKASAPRADDDPVVQRVKALEKQLADAKREKDDADKRVEQTELNRAVIASMTKAGGINPDRDFVHVASKVAKGEAGYTAKGRDKFDQEVDVSLDDFVETWLKANPELRKAQAQSGSGTPAGGPGGGKNATGATVIPKAQWSDMTWFMNNRAKFDKGEYVRGV